jgi:hypothetical protein
MRMNAPEGVPLGGQAIRANEARSWIAVPTGGSEGAGKGGGKGFGGYGGNSGGDAVGGAADAE